MAGCPGIAKPRPPDRVGTSQLSPHLHFGEIAPWRIASALEAQRTARNGAEIDGYIRQLGWRDFAYHLLHHFPDTTNQNLNPRFEGFDWAKVDPVALQAWQRGRTGIPIADAGMRQLWHTGWMHNRVRMIVASFCASICASTGSKARAGSGTRWWMRTWPTTRWAGSGGRHRRRCGALFPRVQSSDASGKIRSARNVHHALGARVGQASGERTLRTLVASLVAGTLRTRVPAHADHWLGRRARRGAGSLFEIARLERRTTRREQLSGGRGRRAQNRSAGVVHADSGHRPRPPGGERSRFVRRSSRC